MNIFCFAYAGGSASMFMQWKHSSSPELKIVPIELAGHGRRVKEPLYMDFDQLLQDIFTIIRPQLLNNSYCLFGHSMGAKIVFELTHKVVEHGLPEPRHIFFSGRGSPYLIGQDEKDYDSFTDLEFIEEVKMIGGTPKEFFKYPELIEVFLPILRSDFKLAKRSPHPSIKKFGCDISVFIGKDDELEAEQIVNWKNCTSALCTIVFFNGGHFFIDTYGDAIIKQIKNILRND